MLCVSVTVTLNPLRRRYLAYCSQQSHCGFLYMVALIGSARAMAAPNGVISASISERSIVFLPSCNSDHAHHAAALVLQDVAVEHPIAGIVGDEPDVDAL